MRFTDVLHWNMFILKENLNILVEIMKVTTIPKIRFSITKERK